MQAITEMNEFLEHAFRCGVNIARVHVMPLSDAAMRDFRATVIRDAPTKAKVVAHIHNTGMPRAQRIYGARVNSQKLADTVQPIMEAVSDIVGHAFAAGLDAQIKAPEAAAYTQTFWDSYPPHYQQSYRLVTMCMIESAMRNEGAQNPTINDIQALAADILHGTPNDSPHRLN